MIKLTTLFLIILITSACDQPRQTRHLSGTTSSSTSTNFNTSGNNTNLEIEGRTDSDYVDGSDTSTNTVSIPTDVSHCDWSQDGQTGFASQSSHLSTDEISSTNGKFTACKSQSSDTVYLQVQTPITDYKVCLIPTTHNGSYSSYIGEPRCLYLNSNQQIYPISIQKNRTFYSNYPMTGVMIMKYKSYFYGSPYNQYAMTTDAYLYCQQWLSQTGDSSYCSSFKSASNYVYVQF